MLDREYMKQCIEDKIYNVIVPQLVELGYTEFGSKKFDVSIRTANVDTMGSCKKMDIWGKEAKLNFCGAYLAMLTEKEAMDVVAHEVCHAYSRAHGHGGEWTRLATLMNNTYGYNITARANVKIDEYMESIGSAYTVACDNCGKTWKKTRMCGLVKAAMHGTHDYRCPYCRGETFVLVEDDDYTL